MRALGRAGRLVQYHKLLARAMVPAGMTPNSRLRWRYGTEKVINSLRLVSHRSGVTPIGCDFLFVFSWTTTIGRAAGPRGSWCSGAQARVDIAQVNWYLRISTCCITGGWETIWRAGPAQDSIESDFQRENR